MNPVPRLFAASAIAALGAVQAADWTPERHSGHDDRDRSGAVYTMTNAADGNAVLVFTRAADGTLTPAGTYATGGRGLGSGLGNQGGVVLSEDGRWLFAVNAGSDQLTVFPVRPNGLGTPRTVDSAGDRPVSVTSSDELVYVLNAGSDSIAGFRLDRRGQLEPIADSTRPLSTAGTAPAEIQFSPDGRALVLTEKATNLLLVYEVGRDGLPEEAPEIIDSAGQTPFGFDFGKHRNLFVSEAAGGAPGASSVSSYRLTRGGGLALVDAAAPTDLTAACWVVVTPDGRYVYTATAGSSAIAGFRADRRGALTRLDADGVTASTGPGSVPIDLAISEDGHFLYALSARTGTLSAFDIAADGSLVPLATQGGLPPTANGLAAD